MRCSLCSVFSGWLCWWHGMCSVVYPTLVPDVRVYCLQKCITLAAGPAVLWSLATVVHCSMCVNCYHRQTESSVKFSRCYDSNITLNKYTYSTYVHKLHITLTVKIYMNGLYRQMCELWSLWNDHLITGSIYMKTAIHTMYKNVYVKKYVCEGSTCYWAQVFAVEWSCHL